MKLSTTQRGYGHKHRLARKRALATFKPGQPCVRCGQPILDPHNADLGHIDGTLKQAYAGLEHRHCNRSAGAALGNMMRGNRRPSVMQRTSRIVTSAWRPSRDW